jgi:hypothetical protein
MLKIVLSNPDDTSQEIDYNIRPINHELGHDWRAEIENLLQDPYQLNKNFCFLGFPTTPRNLEYLCQQMNRYIFEINTFDWTRVGLDPYRIEEWFTPDAVRFGLEYPVPAVLNENMLPLHLKHDIMNRIHNHFEILQGTVESPGRYWANAPTLIRHAIGQINTICHEIESLVLSQRKAHFKPEWLRPSQIMSFTPNAPRHELKPSHRKQFLANGYDRQMGIAYMHWSQIGKTLFEVWRDEGAPRLTETMCSAITHLKYWTGEFDVEWGHDVVYGAGYDWHDQQMDSFYAWLEQNGFDPYDTSLSLGHLPVGEIDLKQAFGTTEDQEVWRILGQHLNVKRIEGHRRVRTYDYTWRDQDV